MRLEGTTSRSRLRLRRHIVVVWSVIGVRGDRATTLPLCFQLLGSAPQTEQAVSTTAPNDLWSCPKCGGRKTARCPEMLRTGVSPALQTVLSRISKVARSDSTVLLAGETGTGKELVARAIHRRSDRASRAFVSLNCAAIPRDLIASELFGREKGAFTGATHQRLGRFELANGGTLFLDEVGELPAETQIALLRVLQEREFQRVGGTRPIRADVRVIAATKRALQAAISAGSFRGDLFYRLNVFPIEIPPLRERREDIPLLVEYFIDRYARKAGKQFRSVEKRTLQVLQLYPWPGNIGESQNVIERSVIVCETTNFSVDESWLFFCLTDPR